MLKYTIFRFSFMEIFSSRNVFSNALHIDMFYEKNMTLLEYGLRLQKLTCLDLKVINCLYSAGIFRKNEVDWGQLSYLIK